jgi:outer membrane lipoprotein-sorting protein
MLNAKRRQDFNWQLIRCSLAVLIGSLIFLPYAFPCAQPVFAKNSPQNSTQNASQNNASALEQILNRMDETAATFKTAQADFEWDTYTAVVQDHDLKTGTIYYRKQGNGVEMSAQVRAPNSSSVQQYVLYKNAKVQIYNTGTKQVQEYDAGKSNADVQSFLVLGFGGGGHEMLKSFDVRYAGRENVQGVDAVKLELTPKSERARGMFNKILLWIDPKLGVSVQQQLFAPDGDYKLSKYSNIKINPKLPEDVFKLKHNG